MKERARCVAVHFFIVFSLALFFYRNLIDHPPSKNIPTKTLGYFFGLGTTWRMYSPTWRYFPWYDWYAKNSQGEWVPVETQNLSPDYVMRRGLFAWPFFDNKLGILQTYLKLTDRYKSDYAEYMCGYVDTKYGWDPSAIKLVENRKYIPPPDKRGDWTPIKGSIDRSAEWEFTCL